MVNECLIKYKISLREDLRSRYNRLTDTNGGYKPTEIELYQISLEIE